MVKVVLHELFPVFLIVVGLALFVLVLIADYRFNGAVTGASLLAIGAIIAAAAWTHECIQAIRKAMTCRRLRRDLKESNVHFYL